MMDEWICGLVTIFRRDVSSPTNETWMMRRRWVLPFYTHKSSFLQAARDPTCSHPAWRIPKRTSYLPSLISFAIPPTIFIIFYVSHSDNNGIRIKIFVIFFFSTFLCYSFVRLKGWGGVGAKGGGGNKKLLRSEDLGEMGNGERNNRMRKIKKKQI